MLRFVDPAGGVRVGLRAVAVVSLLWWSLDEVLRGVNPFRRILGGVVLLATVVGLLASR